MADDIQGGLKDTLVLDEENVHAQDFVEGEDSWTVGLPPGIWASLHGTRRPSGLIPYILQGIRKGSGCPQGPTKPVLSRVTSSDAQLPNQVFLMLGLLRLGLLPVLHGRRTLIVHASEFTIFLIHICSGERQGGNGCSCSDDTERPPGLLNADALPGHSGHIHLPESRTFGAVPQVLPLGLQVQGRWRLERSDRPSRSLPVFDSMSPPCVEDHHLALILSRRSMSLASSHFLPNIAAIRSTE